MTNTEVQIAFANRKRGYSQNLVSSGTSILSYGWWELARWVDNQIITRKGESYSVTTAGKHRNGVYGTEAANEMPVAQATMNL